MGGLRDAGYVDNSTMAIEHRFPDERPERFVSMANELVALDVDVLIAVPCLQRRRHKGLRERCRLSSLWYPTPSWLIPGSASTVSRGIRDPPKRVTVAAARV